jgi:hypothetical protein
MSHLRIFVPMVILLVSCAAPPAMPAAAPEPSATPGPTRTFTLAPSPTLVPPPTAMVAGLAMRVYQVVGPPGDVADGWFTSVQGQSFDYQKILALSDSGHFPGNSFSVEIGTEQFVASQDIPNGQQVAPVMVTRDGQEIFRVSGCFPLVSDTLRGFWTYDGHWVLEVGFLSEGCQWPMLGQIIEDGHVLNDQYGYEEAFGFQTIHGRPFYFFKQADVVNAWYDGQVIPLGYESIPHYGCCSGGFFNPYVWTDMVAFFGFRDGVYYFVQLGTSDSFVP